MWRIDDGTLEIRLFADVGAADRAELEAEGERLLAFAAPEAPRGVRFAPVGDWGRPPARRSVLAAVATAPALAYGGH